MRRRFHMKHSTRKANRGGVSNLCYRCHKRPKRNPKQGYCKQCHNANMRRNRPSWSEMPLAARRRSNCRRMSNYYLRRGVIKRKPCESCGARAQMHHEDYTKPLAVTWLCRQHHLAHHAETERRAAA